MWWNSSSAFPVGGQSCGPRSCRWGSAGCLDLVVWLKSSGLFLLGGSVQAKWCEAPSCIFSSGGDKWHFGRCCAMKHNQDKSLNMIRYAHKKTKAERCDVLFIQTIDTRQLSAWIKDPRDDMIFSARMRNMGQLIRWMEFLSQTNRLSNWGGAKHSHAFWESSRTWEWVRFQSELCRIVRNTRTRERFFDQMSGIARLTKSNCPRQTDACMKGPRASNKSSKNARECFAPPSHLRLESERHKFRKLAALSRCAHAVH